MRKYIIVVADSPVNVEIPLNERGLSIFWVDKYSNNTFGIQGELSVDKIREIPFILSVGEYK